jgi:hypothetical protein
MIKRLKNEKLIQERKQKLAALANLVSDNEMDSFDENQIKEYLKTITKILKTLLK